MKLKLIEPLRESFKGVYSHIPSFAVRLLTFALSFRRSSSFVQVIALHAVQSEDFMTADWYVLIGLIPEIANNPNL